MTENEIMSTDTLPELIDTSPELDKQLPSNEEETPHEIDNIARIAVLMWCFFFI